MKNKKYGEMTTCCWGYRHELLGLVLLVLATILTIVTASGPGIFAMFLVGLGLVCCKHWSHHCCHTDTHCHTDEECHMLDEMCESDSSEKAGKPLKKARSKKVKG
jgi:hypothetical protein